LENYNLNCDLGDSHHYKTNKLKLSPQRNKKKNVLREEGLGWGEGGVHIKINGFK